MEGVGQGHIGFDVLLGFGMLDMGKQLSLMADEVFSSAQKVAGCSHFSWIHIRYKKHTASEQGGDLCS